MKLEMWMGVVRHVLSGVGVFLAAQGWVSEADVEMAGGAILSLVALGWSMWSNKNA